MDQYFSMQIEQVEVEGSFWQVAAEALAWLGGLRGGFDNLRNRWND